ncbi:MAG TPA: alpha/beta hydrolase [Chryseosolibacter sp.]|nr:alpha/beta hydrolase [Chryseosolibacter sp.]
MKTLPIIFLALFCFRSSAQVKSTNSHSEINGLQYYDGADLDTANHKLNLVIPKSVKQPPLLIWIGGGAWSYVNRNIEMDIARKLADKGIAVASVGHRLSPATWKDPLLMKGIKHPEHIKDIARAISFIYKNARKYGYSSRNIFVGGFSSGAHLAALIAMDGQYLRNEGLSKDLLQGVIAVAGTYDILHYYQVLAEGNGDEFADNHVGSVFGLTMNEFEQASPSTYIDSLSAPMLLMSEANTFKYTSLFEDRLRLINYKELEVLHIHRLVHGELWKDLSYSKQSIYREIIVAFIKRHSDSPEIGKNSGMK